VATGERLAFTHDFQRAFEDEVCAIAQPDMGSAGGITEGKKIAGMAEPKYIQIAPHCWGGPIILAAAIQLDAVIPNFLIQENINKGTEGWFGEITQERFIWEDGYFTVPDRPGLGINLNEEALQRYTAI
jgi:L-alanine-DL-glutamate epimerase-like enolase superfamily enzyme